jgi:V/A-type H+-transporting ATPase subunit F
MPTNTYQIAAIGPAELISGLQAIGITAFPAADAATATTQLTNIRSGSTAFACICITESIARALPPEVLSGGKEAAALPVILTIPDLHSTKDSGLEKLRELAKRAIGSDILGG